MGLRQSKRFLEMTDAELLVGEERHDPEPGLVSQSLEETRDGANVEDGRHTEIRICECRRLRKPVIGCGEWRGNATAPRRASVVPPPVFLYS